MTAAPTPIPTLVPVFRLPGLLLVALVDGRVDVGKAELLDGLLVPELLDIVLELESPLRAALEVKLVEVGRKPPWYVILSPVAVPSLTLFARTEASVNATVLEVVGHQHASPLRTVLVPRFASQATHSFEVPLQ
jgi:hypothetical protein